MLASLHIENIALIRRLDLEPAEGFCAFTGETGAGKSIIIDAIGLLCGARGERDLIRSGEDSALVEGMFYPSPEAAKALSELDAEPDEDGALFLQRRLTADGRSSTKINGRAVPLSRLREVSSCLLNIHGQQDTQSLSTEEKQRRLLDAFAGNDTLLNSYRAEYEAFLRLRKERDDARTRAEELAERRDLLTYQLRELKQAKLRAGEEAELLTEHALLANSEKVTENACEAYETLYADERAAAAQVGAARAALHKLAGFLPEMQELCARLEDVKAELTDISESILPYTADRESSAGRLIQVEQRLEQLSALERKYKTDETGLIARLEKVSGDLEALENSSAEQEEREAALREREAVLQKRAEELSKSRAAAAERLSMQVQKALAELDMPKVRFLIRLTEEACGPEGRDRIDFSVSANAGEEPRSIGRIASGGELSRIMLCLQCVLADTERIPTLIFDEIDTGISGKTNEKIGRMMQQIAQNRRQVICVTHAAQLAACASYQYRISKSEQDGRTETSVRLLNREERIAELARIMGGVQVTDTVRKAAEELLESGAAT